MYILYYLYIYDSMLYIIWYYIILYDTILYYIILLNNIVGSLYSLLTFHIYLFIYYK